MTRRATKRASTPVDVPEGVGVDPVTIPPRKKQKGEDKLEKKPHLGDEIRAGRPVPFAQARVGWLQMRDWWAELPDRLKDRVRVMGFGDFMSIVAFRTDRALICALSERWRDETHTFHFPPGEMTITLEDIARCWGLRVTGLPVFSRANDAKPSINRLRLYKMFGARPQSSMGQIDAEWLREAYSPERKRILDKWARNQADFFDKLRARIPDLEGLPIRGREGSLVPTVAGVRADAGEGLSSGRPRFAGGPVDDDVAVVDAIKSDEEAGGSDDDAIESEDPDFDESEGDLIVSDDGDDEIDDGDSEDEGVRPRRVVSVRIDEGGDGDVGRGDEGDDVGPSEGYEWREVHVDGYTRRKRVGIPCEIFQVAKKEQGRQAEVRLRRPRLISARLGDEEHLRAFLLFFLGRCLFANATGNRASCTLIRFVQDLDKVGDYAWGAATLAFLFHSLDSRCRVQSGCKSLRGFVPILQVWVWERIVQCRPERLPARLSCTPRASQWYPNANLRGFADILPPEMAERIKAIGMRLGEQGYRFILNELKNHEVIWQPYQGGPDDEMTVVQEGRALFERDIWLHAPQVAVRLIVSRVARQLGRHQAILTDRFIMHRSYPGWGLKTFKRRHPCRRQIKNWRKKGRKATFDVDASAWSDYEAYWKTTSHRYILPESYSCGASYSISNCAEAAEASSLTREEIPAVAGHWQACPLSEGQGEGTSGGAASDAESILRGEILRLSHLVENKDAEVARLRASLSAERERHQENEAIIEVLEDSREGGSDQDTFEAMRIASEGELKILRAEVDRLQEEARSERDRALAERVALTAQVNKLRAKLVSYEASTQSGAIVASVPSHLSLGEERALIHDQYTERMDRMARDHEEVVADLRRRLDRYRQRAEERGYAFSDSMRAPSQCDPGLSSFASSTRHNGAAP